MCITNQWISKEYSLSPIDSTEKMMLIDTFSMALHDGIANGTLKPLWRATCHEGTNVTVNCYGNDINEMEKIHELAVQIFGVSGRKL